GRTPRPRHRRRPAKPGVGPRTDRWPPPFRGGEAAPRRPTPQALAPVDPSFPTPKTTGRRGSVASVGLFPRGNGTSATARLTGCSSPTFCPHERGSGVGYSYDERKAVGFGRQRAHRSGPDGRRPRLGRKLQRLGQRGPAPKGRARPAHGGPG